MPDDLVPEARRAPEPSQGTLAALLTASLATALADAVSGLVGTAYDAHILRIEPRAHGGAEILVEFAPRPAESTLKIASERRSWRFHCRQAWWTSPIDGSRAAASGICPALDTPSSPAYTAIYR